MIKTPMQEVYFHAQSMDEKSFCQWVRKNLDRLLSKEREDIEDAYNEGYRDGENNNGATGGDISEYSNLETYFNQTFKQ